jgi:hypothetical protein
MNSHQNQRAKLRSSAFSGVPTSAASSVSFRITRRQKLMLAGAIFLELLWVAFLLIQISLKQC